MKRGREQEKRAVTLEDKKERTMLAIRTALGQEEEHDRSKQPVILYRITETDSDNTTFIRAYWPREKKVGDDLMHYLSAFLDTEIDVHVKVVETKNFMGKVFKPSKIVRHKARIVDLYDLFSEIPVTMIGVVEIFLKDSCMDVDM